MTEAQGGALPFLDEEIQTHHKLPKVSMDVSTLALGQIVWAVVPFIEEQKQYWRPTSSDESRTSASTFQIVGGGGDLFKKSLPLHTPKLKSEEEFLVVRGKIRPVILLARCLSESAPKVWAKHHHLVIPRFTVVNKETGQAKVDKTFMNRVRRLEYPQFLFSPADSPLDRDGLFRVDLLQPIPKSHFREPTPLALTEEMLAILRGQVRHLTAGDVSGDYGEWRALLNP